MQLAMTAMRAIESQPWLDAAVATTDLNARPITLDRWQSAVMMQLSHDSDEVAMVRRLTGDGWSEYRRDTSEHVEYAAITTIDDVEVRVWTHVDRQPAAVPGQGYVAVMDTPDVPVYADRTELTAADLAAGWRWVVPALDAEAAS